MTKEEFILQSVNLGYSNKNKGEKWCEKPRKTNTTRKILKSFLGGAKLVGKRTTADCGTAFAALRQPSAISTHTKCERNQTGG